MTAKSDPSAFVGDLLELQTGTALMLAEAHLVATLRLMGMGGLWPVDAAEGQRMVEEKLPAFVEAGTAAFRVALSGAGPYDVAAAWLAPIARHTHANTRRLTLADDEIA